MFGRKSKNRDEGTLDGGEGRGVPLVELEDDDSWLEDLAEFSDRDFGNDDEGGPDRRRDPLRR